MNSVALPGLAAGSGSSASALGLRLLLVVGVLLILVAIVGYLRQSWRRRANRQEDDLPELLVPPEEPGGVTAAPLRGAYLGTTDAGHWLEWFSSSGLGGKEGSYISVYDQGVRIDRRGRPFWIPREAVRGARLERGHAGKVATPGRLLVIAWSLEGRELETGFRGEDRARQPKVMEAVHALIGPMPVPEDVETTAPQPIMLAGTLRRLRSRRQVPGPEGAAQPAGGRARHGHHGAHQGSSARRAMSMWRSRSPELEIADRRGADPYGTGPRAASPGADPYVTNPRRVPFGAGAGHPGAVAGERGASGRPERRPAAPTTSPYGAPVGPPPPAQRQLGDPAVAAPNGSGYGGTGGYPRADDYPAAAGYPDAGTYPAAAGYPAASSRPDTGGYPRGEGYPAPDRQAAYGAHPADHYGASHGGGADPAGYQGAAGGYAGTGQYGAAQATTGGYDPRAGGRPPLPSEAYLPASPADPYGQDNPYGQDDPYATGQQYPPPAQQQAPRDPYAAPHGEPGGEEPYYGHHGR